MSDSSDTAKKPAPKSRWKRLFQNLVLSGGVFLVCIALFEIALRISGYGNLEIYQPDAKLYWRLKPNQDCYTKIDRRPVHINSHGTRDAEFSAEKPVGTIRILSLGDSRTFGWGLTDAETYSRKLEELLRGVEAGNIQLPTSNLQHPKKIEVINGGVNAWSYPQMLVFYRDFAGAWKPDFVILGEANLWTQFSEQNSPEFVKKFMSRVRLKNFLRRFAIYHFVVEVKLKEFYEQHRTKFIPVDPQQDVLFKEQQQKDPDALFRSAIENFCLITRSNGAQPILLFIPTLEDLESTNQSRALKAKLSVSAKLDVPLVDLTPQLAGTGKSLYLEADPVHLNARGNAIVAERVFASMTNHLVK